MKSHYVAERLRGQLSTDCGHLWSEGHPKGICKDRRRVQADGREKET